MHRGWQQVTTRLFCSVYSLGYVLKEKCGWDKEDVSSVD